MASALTSMRPDAVRCRLDDIEAGRYGTVFALDSLEHNDNVPEIVDRLRLGLAPERVLIVSGPTENLLYRLGRRIAGFRGHYHHTNITEIERIISTSMTRIRRRGIPPVMTLFSISVWKSHSAVR